MEFFIKKNATLPLLKLQIVKNGRADFNKFMDMLEQSAMFFSMVDTETGIAKISSRPAGFVEKTKSDPNAETEYYLYYQFQNRDTNKVGRYEGQFMLRSSEGVLILPIREKLYVNVQESFIADDLPYDSCYVSEFPCCINGPFTTTTTTVPCPSCPTCPEPTPTPFVTTTTTTIAPEPSATPTPTPTQTLPPFNDLNFLLIPEGDLEYELLDGITITLESIITPGSINIDYILKSNQVLTSGLTMNFTHNLGLVTGGTLTIPLDVTITSGETSGTSVFYTTDYNFNDLNGSSTFTNISFNPSGYSITVTNENTTFVGPTPTPTPTNTETPTPTPTPTNTETPTPTPTPTSSPVPPNPFISIWRTTAPNETITLPYNPGGNHSGTIDWGDGSPIVPNTYANRSHTYVASGDYTVTIDGGIVDGFSFLNFNLANCLNLIEVTRWGCLGIGNFTGAFYNCSNLKLTGVTDTINLNGITNLQATFYNCSNLVSINNVNSWDVSNIIDMSGMFNSTAFNQPLTGWNVSNVVYMNSMFASSNFNEDISNWDVSSVTNMYGMFQSSLFNQNIGSWNVSGVTTTNAMFTSSLFNQDISGWDVSNVTDMSQMFANSPFNNPLSGWNVSNVTNMVALFSTTPFNQDISNWNVSGVTNMSFMFSTTPFNQDISGWDVSNVTTMANMFNDATSFNQPLSGWNVYNVTNMSGMFINTTFNQDISSWNVSNVTNMDYMFYYATSFNQDLTNWCVTLIPSIPTGFDTGASSWILSRPSWGVVC